MRKWLLIVASVLVSALLLWLSLRDVPLAQVGESIASAQLGWVALSFLSVGLAVFLRGLRWRVLLADRLPPLTAHHLFSLTMLINQLPLRAGEVARTLVAVRYQVPLVTSAASIVVERLLDVLTVLLLLAIAIVRLPDAATLATGTALLLGGVALFGFIVLFAFAQSPALPRRLLAWLESRLPALKRLALHRRVDEALDGLQVLTNGRLAARLMFWNAVAWAVSLFTFYALAQALRVEADLLTFSILSVVLASLSIAVPVTLAGIGAFQGAVVVASGLLGVDAVTGAALGILFHGVTVLAYAGFGVLSVIALGVSVGDVLARAQAPHNQPASIASP